MVDNASVHTAKHTNKFLEDFGIEVLKWPAHSPDLNAIENVFGWMKPDLAKIPGVENLSLDDLDREVKKIFYGYSDARIANLINSMQRRMALCKKNKYGHIRH